MKTFQKIKYSGSIPLAKPSIPKQKIPELLSSFEEILESGIFVNGKYTKAFEEETAKRINVREAVTVNSGTSALQIALEFINVENRNVLVPVNTFIATPNSVLLAKGIPKMVDIGEDLLIDFNKMKEAADANTRALILVHLGGYIHPQILEIREFCTERGITLIEDAAHAHGASKGKIYAGAFGFAGAFSFYATKVVATGVGGMITTNDRELAARARSVRFHGEDAVRGIQNRLGANLLMTEFQAALGLYQMRELDGVISRRMDIARRYDAAFRDVNGLKIFPLPSDATSGYYKYPVRIYNARELRPKLAERGIQTGTAYWPPIHLQPVYRARGDYKEGDFPMAEKILPDILTLPLYPAMTDAEVTRVIETVLEICADRAI